MKKHTVWCVRAIGNYFLRTIFRIIEFWCVHAELPPGQCKAIFTSEYSSIRVWCVLQWHLYIFFSEILVSEGGESCARTHQKRGIFLLVRKNFQGFARTHQILKLLYSGAQYFLHDPGRTPGRNAAPEPRCLASLCSVSGIEDYEQKLTQIWIYVRRQYFQFIFSSYFF